MFLEAFRRQFVPDTAQRRLQAEFMGLSQGSLTVDEYETRFLALGRYDPDTMYNETRKVHRFITD